MALRTVGQAPYRFIRAEEPCYEALETSKLQGSRSSEQIAELLVIPCIPSFRCFALFLPALRLLFLEACERVLAEVLAV